MQPKRGMNKSKVPEDKNDGRPTHATTISQLRQLLESQLLPMSSGPPKSEEDRQVFFVNLVRLKESRLTNAECATKLGVSERTISNYLAEPLYEETRAVMIGTAHESGHMLLSEVIPYAVAKLFELLNDRSGFVQFKAAETILTFSGYALPREDARSDSRDGVAQFLREVEEKRKIQQQNVYNIANVEIHQGTDPQQTVVDAITEPSESASRYQELVQPGGRLPASFATSLPPIERLKRD